ncbi:alpha/beta hydrolase [Terribacillus saccharophilus]|uniref:alpha/beta hydrolase n=1 Tax=Terribacillus saccharophilus TaxID=361277 RepID=UPI003982165C
MSNKKRSAHLLDKDLKAIVELIPDSEVNMDNYQFVRQTSNDQFDTRIPDKLHVHMEEKYIPGPDGAPDVRVLIFKPENAKPNRPAYLDIHGGGFFLGIPEMQNPENALIASELSCTVVSVDYRLAPETRYPGAIEDCYAALKWIHDNAEELEIDRSRIAIGGSSAGGGLTAALAILARDRGEVKVAFQNLIVPMLDDRTGIKEPHPYAGEYVFTRQNDYFGWSALLGHEPGIDGVSLYASPARAEDLSGLPPTFICIGALDLFIDEGIEYAQRLIRAGVPTEFHVYPGAPHVIPSAIRDARVSKALIRDMLNANNRAFYDGIEEK